MAKNMHQNNYSKETLLKLNIFRECFKEWFPVFIYDKWTTDIHIFDLFAGSGTDTKGELGSPLILIDEAAKSRSFLCKKKPVHFYFNDQQKNKTEALQKNIEDYINSCKNKNQCNLCTYENNIHITNKVFQDIFSDERYLQILRDKKYGKFLLLDQYGFKEVDNENFRKLISFVKTDFIFFISSSTIKRFKAELDVKKYINTDAINFKDHKNVHRQIAQYFKALIPTGMDFYLHHFTIQNRANYYGLIFGTAHTLGMEKFLKVCWKHDKFSGEANFNIDDNHEEGTLFYDPNHIIKKEQIKTELEKRILEGKIDDNVTGLKQCMVLGGLPVLFIEVIEKLRNIGKVIINGEFNNSKTNIHKIKKYTIHAKK